MSNDVFGMRQVQRSFGVLAALVLCVAPAASAKLLDPTKEPTSQGELNRPANEYDPLRGMDANGRIPSVELPRLAHPDRWRYVPEGRLKPGNPLDRFLVSSFVIPYAYSDSETGVGIGVAITDLDFRDSRRREFTAALISYSTEGQQNYELKWRRWLHHIELPQGGILREERSLINAEVGYEKSLTQRFFGLGGGTTDQDETSYSDESIYGDIGVERTFPDPGSNWVFHLSVRGETHNLAAGRVKGVASMDDVHPGLFGYAKNYSLGWLRGGLRYDTRDSQDNPYQGWHLGALAAWAPVQTGGAMGALYTLTASKVFRVPPLLHDGGDRFEENPPTDTLAFGLWNEYTSGVLPFVALPTLGGSDRHRGFIGGRFHGRASWLGSAEYRLWVLPRGVALTDEIRFERVGIALFYEAGAVANGANDLVRQSVRHSYGVSLRLGFERTAPFRFDFGFSGGKMEFSMGYGLTF